jgi:NtrC-family two-component system response regulator AlgB
MVAAPATAGRSARPQNPHLPLRPRLAEALSSTKAEPALRPCAALVIADVRAVSEALSLALRLNGCKVACATTVTAAVAQARIELPALACCALAPLDAIELIPKLLDGNPSMHILLVSDQPTVETAVKAVRAVRAGAVDCLRLPLDAQQLRQLIDRALAAQPQAHACTTLICPDDCGQPAVTLTSRSSIMHDACGLLFLAAQASVPVLLRGESGTGKGVFALSLHALSTRAAKPFIVVNCPALTDELMTSELFGHAKGSFTGAIRDHVGKVTLADGGTLFLDELGDLSPGIQAKLLRFLQEHTYERLGDSATRKADVRIVAATNRDLSALVLDGRFREDLLYRLNVVDIVLPPLRERREDILDLCRHFLRVCAAQGNRLVQDLSPAAQELLLNYSWPGNIRELQNEVQRIAVLWSSRIIEPEAFSERIYAHCRQGPLLGDRHTLAAIEQEHIRRVLSAARSFDEAAGILGITPSTLWRKRRRIGL